MFVRLESHDKTVVLNTDNIIRITEDSCGLSRYYTIYYKGGMTDRIYVQEFEKLIELLKCQIV